MSPKSTPPKPPPAPPPPNGPPPAAGRRRSRRTCRPRRTPCASRGRRGCRRRPETSLNFSSAVGVVRVAVRVVLARQLAVRLLDLLVGRLLRDAQHLVELVSQSRLLLAHHDAGRPDQLLAEPVALLHHLDDRPGSAPSTGSVESASCRFGSNFSPVGSTASIPLRAQRLPQARGRRAAPRAASPSSESPSGSSPPPASARSRSSSTGTTSRASSAFPRGRGGLNLRRHPLPEVLEVSLASAWRVRGTRPSRCSASASSASRSCSTSASAASSRGWRRRGARLRGRSATGAGGGSPAPTGPAGRALAVPASSCERHLSSPSSTTSASTTSSSSRAAVAVAAPVAVGLPPPAPPRRSAPRPSVIAAVSASVFALISSALLGRRATRAPP